MSWRPVRSAAVCGGLLLAMLLASCPRGDGDAASGGVTGALAVYVEAHCDALFHCAIADDDMIGERIAYADEATCLRVLNRYAQSDSSADVRRWLQLEAAGKLVADASKFEACRELGRTCSPFLRKCFESFQGTLALGEACEVSEECAGDAYCAVIGGGQACGRGSCKARVALGERCSSSDECQAGSAGIRSCTYGALETRCADIANEVAGAGQACGYSGEAGAARLVSCGKGLWCDYPAGEIPEGISGTCKAPIAVGAACDGTGDVCEGSAVCAREGPERRCKKVALGHEGEACNDPTVLALCDVFRGFSCGPSKSCVALGDGSAGSRCDTSRLGELVPCNPGLHCALASSRCEPRRELGEGCEGDAECGSGFCGLLSRQCQVDACGDVTAESVTSD